MDVSIVVPYYKRKDLFLNQLASLARSDYPREQLEIVLVEDGTSDFEDWPFGETGLRVKYVRHRKADPNNHTPPRNQGLRVAEGEIVVFLDCDQVVSGDFVGQHVEFHRRLGPDVLQLGTRKELHPNQDLADLSRAKYDEDVRVGLFRAYRSDGEGMLAMWANVWSHNISVRREHAVRAGGFDEDFRHWGLEDQEFGLRLEREGIRIRYNPAIEVHHQYHKPAWGARIRKGWLGNYAHLVDKYRGDPRVRCIALLGEVLDPSLAVRVRQGKMRDLSTLFYTKMEIVSRCLAGREDFQACLDQLPQDAGQFLSRGIWE